MPAAVETMAYTLERGVPWHGLGTGVEGLMTWQEAEEAAGLGWKVGLEEVQTAGGVVIPNKRAVVRDSDGRPLGVVGTDYRPVQNSEAFQFADAIVADSGNHYETAGSLYDGRIVFLAIDLGAVAPIKVNGDSDVKTFLVLSNSHDGSSALKATVTPVRVVCANTLNLAFKGAQGIFYVRHSGNIESKMAAARQALDISVDYMARFEQVAERLYELKVTDERAEAVVRDAFGMTKAVEERGPESEWFAKHHATRVLDLYDTTIDLKPIHGTGWGVLNAVAEYVDHNRTYGKGAQDRIADVKMNTLLWGEGSKVVNRTAALLDPSISVLMDTKVAKSAARVASRSK